MVNAPATPDLTAQITARALAEGFAVCGFASAGEDPLRAARLEQWLGEGHHGSMAWMAARLDHRRSPQGLWPEARSVIALGMSYAPAHDPRALETRIPTRGFRSMPKARIIMTSSRNG